MPSRDKLAEFTARCRKNITGDETFRSGTPAQIFLDRLFQAFDVSTARIACRALTAMLGWGQSVLELVHYYRESCRSDITSDSRDHTQKP